MPRVTTGRRAPSNLRHRSELLDLDWTGVQIARAVDCDGRIRQLYVRLSNPQRWEAIGYVCDGCGRTDLRLGRLRDEQEEGA